MSLPSNFQANTLYPKVVIKDENGVTQYTHESLKIFPAGTRDFEIASLSLQQGHSDNYGNLILVIPDHSNVLTDNTKATRPSLIEREWEIILDLGTTSATLQRYFHGKIKSVIVQRPGTNLQEITIICIGWGIILKERMTKLARNQDKNADGIGLDDTDTKTRVDNLLLDIFEDKDHQVEENITQLANITAATTTDGLGICQTCTDVKIANVNFATSTYAQAIQTLASIANTSWRINEDRKLVVHDIGAHDSGMLFSNDVALTGDTSNWTSTKLGYLKQFPLEWSDDSIDSFYSFIHGFGHFNPTLAASDGETPDASDNLDTAWHAIPFSYDSDTLFKIAVRIIKTGTPPTPHNVQIWGEAAGGGPEPSDVRRIIKIAKEKLQSLGTSVPADWFEIPVTPRVDIQPGENLFIVFPSYGTGANTININYKSGTGTFWDSADGVTWTSRVGKTAFRAYEAKRLFTTLEVIEAESKQSEPREKLFPVRSDLEEQTVRQTLLAAGEILGKEKREYSSIIVSPPQDRINVMQFCRIIDKKTGLDIKASINGLIIKADSTRGSLGVDEIELSLVEFR